MTGRIRGITVEIGGNTTKLDKALRAVDKTIRATQSDLKDVGKLLKLDPKNTILLTQKQDLLEKAVGLTKDRLNALKEAQSSVQEGTPAWDALQREIVDTEQSLKSLEKQQKDFGSVGTQQVRAVAGKMQEFGKKVQEVGRDVKEVGDNLTKHVTGPILAIGGASLVAFNEVDEGLDIIVKKTGASGEALNEMQGIMERLATTIPTDFVTAGAAIGEVNTRFGLTGQELEELSAKFIKFADLNDTDVSSAIDKVQAAMAMFGVETDSAGDVLDILNKAGQDTGVSLDQLSSSLLSNGTALQEMGFGINTAVGFLAGLEKNGIDSASVMTGLKKALQTAAKEGKPLNEALAEMQEKMAGAKDDTEAAKIAMELFGNKAGPAISKAVREGRLSFDELTNVVRDWGDSVDETFENTLDPIDQWKLTMNTAKTAAAEVGATVGTVVAPYLKKLADYVKELKAKWDALSPATQDAIVKGALIVAAIGPIISLIGSVIIGIGGVITAVGTITGVLAPVIALISGPLVIGIGAAIAAGVLIIKNWDKIKSACKQMKEGLLRDWNTIKTGVTQTAENLKNAVSEKWEALKTKVTTTVSNVKTSVTNTINSMKSSVTGTVDSLKSAVSSKFDAVKSAMTKPIESAKTTITNAVNKIKSIVNNAKLSLPHFKLPHFRISGGQVPWGIGGQGTKPSISVDWYKKAYDNPIIFSQPTVLPTVGGMKGFGDGSGAEIVMSLNKLREMVGAAGDIYITVNASPGMDVNQLADEVARRMTQVQRQKGAVYA